VFGEQNNTHTTSHLPMILSISSSSFFYYWKLNPNDGMFYPLLREIINIIILQYYAAYYPV
jgi:hypothetical protein